LFYEVLKPSSRCPKTPNGSKKSQKVPIKGLLPSQYRGRFTFAFSISIKLNDLPVCTSIRIKFAKYVWS